MAVLVAFVNVLTAALTVAAIVYYAYVYTVLLEADDPLEHRDRGRLRSAARALIGTPP